MKKSNFGEFPCPYCDAVFFQKKKLDGHIGGAHRRNITDSEKPRCKFCGDILVKDKNWAYWAIKQRNLICIPCKRVQNNKSYRNRMQRAENDSKIKISKLRERIRNATKTNSVKINAALSKGRNS